jgi:peptidyl-prolyl cis-trans isomerase B (cyclophilin B)
MVTETRTGMSRPFRNSAGPRRPRPANRDDGALAPELVGERGGHRRVRDPARAVDHECVFVAARGGGARRAPPPPPDHAEQTGEVPATVETSAGNIDLTLDADAAPCTVNSFVSLAEQGYFDDTECHRLTEGGGLSVLQCGDPTASGSGGPGYSFDDELTEEETYLAGTLAMANAGPDTNGSQFFMVYADSQLPPLYTVFGTIGDDGLAVLEEVAAAGSDSSNGPGDGRPNTPVEISSVTVE